VATLHGAPPALGFPAAFFVLAGFSLMVPGVTRWTSTVMGKVFAQCRGSGVAIQRIAVKQMLRNLHRTTPTIAALAAAVAMTVGISVMIHSFRGSVMDWAARTLTADLFIAPASNELLGLAHTLPEGTASWWSSRRDVVAVGTFREEQVRLANERTNGEPVTMGVIDGPARGEIDFLGGDGVRKSAELARGSGVALSESLGRRLSLGPGDTITLQAPDGPLTLPVIDLYRDYTRDRGIALVHASVFRRHWNQRGVHSLAIVFRKGTENEMIEREKEAFLAAFGGSEAFACYSNAGLRARILEIFNQTFAVTAVLRSISIAVAFGGVMLTLGILVMERSRDLGVLRSMGAGDGQVIRLVLTEAALIGAIASVVGLFSGAALSLVLTWVINKAFFGWSIQLAFPWAELMFLPLWMTSTALVAGALPARTALSITPAASIRME
jgi:putative ABC transport system permease protein